jgi:predicted restriction endonuclease
MTRRIRHYEKTKHYRAPRRRNRPRSQTRQNNLQYDEWRKNVKERDGYKCQFPGCKDKKRLEAHHILPWSEYPTLRYNIQNGITLCRRHHNMVKGREHQFIKIFQDILIRQNENNN